MKDLVIKTRDSYRKGGASTMCWLILETPDLKVKVLLERLVLRPEPLTAISYTRVPLFDNREFFTPDPLEALSFIEEEITTELKLQEPLSSITTAWIKEGRRIVMS
jgi:hypothetical protein